MTHESFTAVVVVGVIDMLLGDGRAPSSYLLMSCATQYACFCLLGEGSS